MATYRQVKAVFDEMRADPVLKEFPWVGPLLEGLEGLLQCEEHLDDPISEEVAAALDQLSILRVVPVPDPKLFPNGRCGMLFRVRDLLGLPVVPMP